MSLVGKLVSCVFLCALSSQAVAALPPRSPDELEEAATLIVTGKVASLDVSQSGLGSNVDWVVELKAEVESVQKGNAATPGDLIEIRCWRLKSRPSGWAGPSGHFSIPDRGSQFEMWLRKREDGAWEPLQPNGIQLLDGSTAFDFESLPNSSSSSATLYLLVFLGVAAGVVIVVVARLKPASRGLDARDQSDAPAERE